jgi:adenylate cyclase
MAVLAPPLLILGLAAALVWLDPAGVQTALCTRLLHVWQNLAHATVQPSRPPAALPLEILTLLVLGGLVIAMVRYVRVSWAGFFTLIGLAAGFETSWFLFFSQGWLIDAATPGLGLVLVFLAAVQARAVHLRRIRTQLRIAFADTLPPATIETIARRPDILAPEGEIRTVTYMVCGMSRLAELAADYRSDPKSFSGLMDRVLSPLLAQAVARGATIDRLTADGFAAFWNAPLNDDDHAFHACQTAQAVSTMMARLNDEIAGVATPTGKAIAPLHIDVGIATGEVVAGGFAAIGRLAYGVSGEVVTLASRLQSLSPHYGSAVIVSEETQKAAERNFAFLEVDYVAAGSDDKPVKLFAMLGQAQASPKVRALRTFHEHIFHALRGQQWAQARDLISQCRRLSGASQALYDLYLARVRYFESNPPGANWDGAFRPVLK